MPKPLKILIVKTSSIGDIIQSFDVLDYLHQKDFLVSIDWVVEKESFSFVNSHPLVHRAICFSMKNWKKAIFSKKTLLSFKVFIKKLRFKNYDLIIDLQGNWKSSIVLFFSKGEKKIGFGSNSVREKINLLFTDCNYNVPKNISMPMQYVKLLQKHFADKLDYIPKRCLFKIEKPIEKIQNMDKLKIMVCPGSRWENKKLSTESLVGFLSLIEKRFSPHYFFCWGNLKEKVQCEELYSNFKSSSQILDKMPINYWQNTMAKMDLIMAMDSCALHLAAMADIPTFSFFGPTSMNVFNPSGSKHFGIEGRCPYNKSFSKQCPALRSCKSGACIKELKKEQIYSIFVKWWMDYQAS